MTNSWNGPQLGSPIRTDVPELQKKLIALLKQDPTSVADIPSGAKRLVNTSGVQWQVQQYNGSSWAAIGKLMHDVDTLDGYHAAITPAANTVAVRNADKKLEGDITGNAATASSAATLSETLPVNKGGTGGTTSAAARTNLGVPPTSHASSGTAYGLGSNLNYGHVRGDGETTDVVAGEIVVKDVLFNNLISLTDSGALGRAKYISTSQSFNIDTDDFDLVVINASSENSSGTYPPFLGFLYIRQFYYSRTSSTVIGNRMQVAFAYNANGMWRRYYTNGSWSDWVKVIDRTDLATTSTPGLVKPDTVNYTTAVDNTGILSVISAPKTIVYDVEGTADSYKDGVIIYYGEKSSRQSKVAVVRGMYENEANIAYLLSSNPSTDKAGASIGLVTRSDGTLEAKINCNLVLNNGNSIIVAQNALETGDLIVSLKSTHRGCLLCNGSAVSRITYADLFAILGTTFGEGDGSTTFNLPDFRNKTLWGANGNLMAILAAGLPNITGRLSIGALTNNASGAIARESSSVLRSTTDAGDSSGFTFDASRSSSIYGKSTTVQPPAIAVNFFIKY